MRILLHIVTLISFCVLFSCSDDISNPISNENIELNVDSSNIKLNVYADNNLNDALEILSIAYANSLQDKQVRNIIKKEALKKFDGDYDILHEKVSKELINGEELTTLLAHNLKKSQTLKSLRPINEEYIDSLASLFENLQVAVPIHCEDWDVENFVPKVIFLPTNFTESKFDMVKAYDAQGNYEWVSSVEEPTEPYVVIGRSERVGRKNYNEKIDKNKASSNIDNNLKSATTTVIPNITSLTYGNPLTHFVKWSPTDGETGYEVWRSSGGAYSRVAIKGANDNEFVDESYKNVGTRYKYKVRSITSNGFSDWGTDMSINASERTNNKKLRSTKLYMSKSRLKAVESWLSGAPEIVLYIVTGEGSSVDEYTEDVMYTSSVLEPGRRNDIKDKWWTIYGGGMVTDKWSIDDNNNPLVLNFVWVEQDWEDGLEVPINFKIIEPNTGLEFSTDTEFEIPDSKGEMIGCFAVYWDEAKSMTYSSNGFSFDLSEY